MEGELTRRDALFYFITGFMKGACPWTLVVSIETLTLKDGDSFPIDTELLSLPYI